MRVRVVLAALSFAAIPAVAQPAISGFTTGNAAQQRTLEQRFDSHLRHENLDSWMRELASHPHHLGSAKGKANAEMIARLFRSWGYEAKVTEYQVLFPTPRTRVLEMVEPARFAPMLAEPPLREDATSSLTREQLPSYNAYSIDGNVTGELVYVNYGIPSDYEELHRRGVDVRGKIVIARYGAAWRGIKPKVAAEHGAIGCIIYSDPRDDGYFEGDVYPKGPFRNELGVQRGSVMDMPIHPGDPTTPFIASTAGAKRLDRSELKTLTKIPVMPISYADAQPLLERLGGPVAPAAWRGALPITYHLGPGPAKVILKLEFDWKMVPLYNVIATMRGSEKPDEWVIRGNHHDAWVNGADDPVSGMVAMMEEARAIGELTKTGWKPKRTLVYAAWDGEEQGLLGSTEWAEEHAEELRRKAVIYINTDGNGRGFLYAGGSHALERFVTEVARDVPDPQTKVSVLERTKAAAIANATRAERDELRSRELYRLAALGSGSDFTPFFQHLGISSLHLGYGGESDGGSYHSIYDSIDHYTRFGDPGFHYGIALAKTAGRMVLRLSSADALPFSMTTLASTVKRYAGDAKGALETMRAKEADARRMREDRTLELASDPTQKWVSPKVPLAVPHLNFAPLDNAVDRLERAAAAYDKRIADFAAMSPAERTRHDALMIRTERLLTISEGLEGRPWYRHAIYAPGFYTGYGVKTLPGVTEAIELERWPDAEREIAKVAQVLNRLSEEVEKVSQASRQQN